MRPASQRCFSRFRWPRIVHAVTSSDELDPPFEIIEPADWRGPVAVQLARIAAASIRAPSWRPSRLDLGDAAPLRGFLRRRADRRRGAARLSADAGAFPALLSSTSTASPTSSIRACSRAGCRPSPTPARCGSPAGSARSRAWSATRRKSTTSASRSTTRCARIESLYKPYHRALRRLFTRVHRDFGAAVLIDCHSMPSTAGAKDERPRADMCWATATARAASASVAETIEATLRELGYAVSRNKPYAGGFITEHYGNPAAGLHAIQLEINRALYMDERRYERIGRLRRAGRRPGDAGRPAGRHPARGTAALPRGGGITGRHSPRRCDSQKKGRSRLQAAQV